MDKAKHVYNEERCVPTFDLSSPVIFSLYLTGFINIVALCCPRLQQWLEELCGTTTDPSLGVVWEPDPSLTCTTARLTISDSLAASKGYVYHNLKLPFQTP